jgi:hypothetical protein
MINWLKKTLFKKKPKRIELKLLSWSDADNLIRRTNGAWTIAKEEDKNKVIGMVWLERLQND